MDKAALLAEIREIKKRMQEIHKNQDGNYRVAILETKKRSERLKPSYFPTHVMPMNHREGLFVYYEGIAREITEELLERLGE